jgi:SAM-dependent methyltransferase
MPMNSETISLLRQINHTFYDELGPSFSVTRAQIQPGVKQLLPAMLKETEILDLGCGNGTLAEALALANFEGHYLGVDGSRSLLGFAAERVKTYLLLKANFQLTDLICLMKILQPALRGTASHLSFALPPCSTCPPAPPSWHFSKMQPIYWSLAAD